MQTVMSVSRMWSWVCLIVALITCSMLNDASEASQAALVGTVYCDTCFDQYFSKSSHFISGALVAVECGGHRVQESGGRPSFQKKVKTNKKGEFRVKLPFSATKHVNEIKGCSVKLISSSEADCAMAATTTSSSIRLKVKTPANHVFSAGFFMFQPLEQPKRCRTQSRNANSNDEFIAPTPLSSPVVDVILPPPPHPSATTFPIPPDDLTDINNFGFQYLPNQFLPPSLIPSFQLQPPPDSMFNPSLQPPPDSMFNPDSQPPPASMFNPDSQPPPDSMFNPGIQPPPDSMFNPDSQPPPASMFNPMPLPSPPAPIFDTFQPSPPSQLFTPPPPSSIPSLPFPPLDPHPDLIQSMPPPPPSKPPGELLPPFPPFPFQPRQGLPKMPPATSLAQLKKHHLLD